MKVEVEVVNSIEHCIMNKHFDLKVLVLFSGLILLFASCKKETIAPPTVKLFGDGQPSSVSFTTAGVSAEVSDQGGAEVKSRGFAYGVSGGAMDTIFCLGGLQIPSCGNRVSTRKAVR